MVWLLVDLKFMVCIILENKALVFYKKQERLLKRNKFPLGHNLLYDP